MMHACHVHDRLEIKTANLLPRTCREQSHNFPWRIHLPKPTLCSVLCSFSMVSYVPDSVSRPILYALLFTYRLPWHQVNGAAAAAAQRASGSAQEAGSSGGGMTNSRTRTVPSTPLARVFGFGQLAAGLAMGTVAEAVRQSVRGESGGSGGGADSTGGQQGRSSVKQYVASDANAERLAETLCRMRGAALKLGQMLSIQVSKETCRGMKWPLTIWYLFCTRGALSGATLVRQALAANGTFSRRLSDFGDDTSRDCFITECFAHPWCVVSGARQCRCGRESVTWNDARMTCCSFSPFYLYLDTFGCKPRLLEDRPHSVAGCLPSATAAAFNQMHSEYS